MAQTTMASDSPDPIPAPDAQSQSPPPVTTTLRLYKRLPKGRKALFAPSDSAPASYFVANPIPHRHHSRWTPVFYRGDNPKYTPSATITGRAFRNALWGKIEFQLGEGVGEELENERRRKEAKKLKTKNKFRKAFGASAKDAAEDLEEKPVLGQKMVIHVRRSRVFNRRVDWELNGVAYRWTGTRMFSTSFMKGAKGWSHSLKLVRVSDHALMATFEKSRWSSFSSSIKTGGPPNKSKQFVGTLRVHVPSNAEPPTANGNPAVPEIHISPETVNDLHWGNLAETELTDSIVLTCWIVAEAEHRLRLKVLDVLQDIAEKAGEGGG